MKNLLKERFQQLAGIKPLKEYGLRGQLAGDSALDMADYLRRYGVKKILNQPNDRVTYFQLNNASQAPKVVQMLKKMFGIKAQIDNHMYSPTPAVKFDNDQILSESKLNESIESKWNSIDVSRKAEKEIGNKEWNERTAEKLGMLVNLNSAGKFKKNFDEDRLQGWVDQNFSWERVTQQFKK